MAQTSFPFENVDTTEVQFSQWARHINEGIRPDFANELEPFADDSGLNVKVKSGQAMVRGHYYASTAEETLTITTPDATNPRIDSVVLELDIVANSILLKVVAGTPGASPVAPTLTQSEDGNVYQLLLANVDVAAGVFSIEAGDVTDLRTYMFQGIGKWTTATRPENPIAEQTIGYNSDLNTHEVWNGSAWTSVFAPITTEGDLALGDSGGNAERLPIGPADTVLTSNGTTALWAQSSGGAQNFVNLEFNKFATIDVDFPSNTLVRFAIISTSSAGFDVDLFDSSNTKVTTITVDRDNPFTYFTNATAIAKLVTTNDVVDEKAILVFSDPTAAQEPTTSQEILIFTSTQSVTLETDFEAYVFGGGGGAEDKPQNVGISGGGAGGGSGFFSTGIIGPGTYTVTIGAGGGDGGTSSIGGISAAGGLEGKSDATKKGGDGGSGGGGGPNQGVSTIAIGGINGQDGDNNSGTGGSGSGVTIPQTTLPEILNLNPDLNPGGKSSGGGFYKGGNSGNGTDLDATPGEDATNFTGGGGGPSIKFDGGFGPGSNGGQGFIMLVEVS